MLDIATSRRTHVVRRERRTQGTSAKVFDLPHLKMYKRRRNMEIEMEFCRADKFSGENNQGNKFSFSDKS